MDDIFSEPKDDAEKEGDSNIEWKKSGIDKQERMTLKINVKEANMYNANKRNNFKTKHKARTPLDVPKGFKKISRKIRDAMDEEEDEDDYILVPVFEDVRESSLMRALNDDEKKILKQIENINNVRLQENVGKDAAVAQAERIIMKAGLGHLDQRIIDEQKLRSGRQTLDEVVAEAVKHKLEKRKPAAAEKIWKEEKVMPVKEKNVRRQATELKVAVEKAVRATEEKAQSQVSKKEIKEDKPTPQNDRREEKLETEVLSIKQDEKAAVERVEKELSAVKEQKPAEPVKKEQSLAEKDLVNQDNINKIDQKKTEPVKERLPEEKVTENAASLKQDEKAAVERVEKELSAVKEQKPAEKPKKDGRLVAKDSPVKDKVNQDDVNTTVSPEKKLEKQSDNQEMKDIIMAKSGRTYKERQLQVDKPEKQQLSENEQQQIAEAQMRKRQDRER